nr:alpha-S2-casein-like [Microcebus murinus]
MNEMESSRSSSSEESTESSTEKIKITMQEQPSPKQLNEIYQLYQQLNFLQYLQALQQHQIVMNQWDQFKTNAYPFIPNLDNEQLCEECSSFPKEQDKQENDVVMHTSQDKINQYYKKFFLPQYPKAVQQHQKTMTPVNHINTNADQIIPTLRNF